MRRRDVKALLERRGISPRTALGQNFLTDPNLLLFIVRTAEVDRDDVVLEVGTGTAGLSVPLAKRASRLVAVELDPVLFALTTERLEGFRNVELIHRDVLAGKHEVAPEVLAAVRTALAAPGAGSHLKLVANLPYSIATPLIVALLETDLPFERMVVMIQKEVADRLSSPPGSRTYGAPSVLCALHAEVSIVRTVPRHVFWPRPKVESAIIDIRRRERIDPAPHDYDAFVDLVRALFSSRRKMIRHLLKKRLGGAEPAAAVLDAAGIDGDVRVETLAVGDVVRLVNAIGEHEAAD